MVVLEPLHQKWPRDRSIHRAPAPPTCDVAHTPGTRAQRNVGMSLGVPKGPSQLVKKLVAVWLDLGQLPDLVERIEHVDGCPRCGHSVQRPESVTVGCTGARTSLLIASEPRPCRLEGHPRVGHALRRDVCQGKRPRRPERLIQVRRGGQEIFACHRLHAAEEPAQVLGRPVSAGGQVDDGGTAAVLSGGPATLGDTGRGIRGDEPNGSIVQVQRPTSDQPCTRTDEPVPQLGIRSMPAMGHIEGR